MAELSDLIVPETAEDIEETLLGLAEGAGLPVTAWQPGSTPRALVAMFSEVLADAWYGTSQIANGVVLERSAGPWQDLLAANYDEARLAATFASGTVTLTDNGGGPHTITAGAFVVATPGGLRYRATSGGTLTLNGTLDITVQAEATGATYNVATGTITEVVTAAPTVTVTNPVLGTSGTWLSTIGTDAELDAALRKRLQAKWGTLSTGSPVSAYVFWALSTPGVSRVAVNDANPLGPGTIIVYIDSASAVATLQATLDAIVPAGSDIDVDVASTVLVDVPGTVYVERAKYDAAVAALPGVFATLSTEIEIGGDVIKSEIIERVMGIPGVRDFTISGAWAGSPNIALSATQIPSLSTASILWVAV
jgi:uncharacterized phage protein gp47/JayE